MYRDDTLDTLKTGLIDKQAYQDHMDSPHNNIKEGGYLNLWFMLQDAVIEWKHKLRPRPCICAEKAAMTTLLRVSQRVSETGPTIPRRGFQLYRKTIASSGYNYLKTHE